MKKIISQIDKRILEKHPLTWNTKILWMSLIAISLHILFFAIGVLVVMNPSTLHGYNIFNTFYDSGLIFISIIISLIVIVLWLLQYFKNNAFKNFYPSSPVKLLLQFGHVFYIIFICTTFYYSYSLGLQVAGKLIYPDPVLENMKEVSSKSGIFLTHNLYDYEVSEVSYPPPLDSLYRQNGNIIWGEPFYEFANRQTQFFNYRIEYVSKDEFHNGYEPKNRSEIVIYDTPYNQDTLEVYIKDKVVDVSSYLKTAKPSLYNYGSIYLKRSDFSLGDHTYKQRYNYNGFSFNQPEEIHQAAWLHDFLDQKSNKKFKTLFHDFLSYADDLNIRHNLNTSNWTRVYDESNNYEINELINSGVAPYEKEYYSYAGDSKFEKYAKQLYKDLYFDSNSFTNSIDNINRLRNENIFHETILIFLWIACIISVLIFLFKVTDIKTLLLSIVAGGVASIFTSLAMLILSQIGIFDFEIGGMFSLLLLLLFWIVLGLRQPFKRVKLLNGIALNVMVFFTLPVLWNIVVLLDEIIDSFCSYNEVCLNIWTDYMHTTHFVVFIIFVILLSFYAKRFYKWRASYEG